MSPRAAAAVARASAGTIHAPGRPRTAPPRRRSGATARPRPQARTRPAPRVTVPAGSFLPVLDRLLRGPVYIAVVGILLAGIVFFNVDVLELNHGIARTDTRAAQLKRENAALTLTLAKLGSSERIQREALMRGLVLPQPGDVRYLRAHREDAGRALRVMTAPDSSSAAAGVPAVVTQQSVAPPGTTPATATTPATTTTPAPVVPAATTTPAPASQTGGQTPVSGTAQPAPTTGQTPTATPATPGGAAAAGQ